jgi:hypothetical protein
MEKLLLVSMGTLKTTLLQRRRLWWTTMRLSPCAMALPAESTSQSSHWRCTARRHCQLALTASMSARSRRSRTARAVSRHPDARCTGFPPCSSGRGPLRSRLRHCSRTRAGGGVSSEKWGFRAHGGQWWWCGGTKSGERQGGAIWPERRG